MDGVYKLNVHKPEKCLLAANKTASAKIWHRRFGHINSSNLNKMKDGAVDGLLCVEKFNIERSNCIVCCEGKQTRLPFKNKGVRASKVLEVIHGDVCGPMETKSIGGSRYFLVLKDDYSRMCFVYFLRAKSEVYDCFKSFKNMVKNQKEKKIKIFKSDNGGEFTSREFESFLELNGIIHQTSNSFTPQQSGLSERMVRTLVERAKYLLFDVNFGKKLLDVLI